MYHVKRAKFDPSLAKARALESSTVRKCLDDIENAVQRLKSVAASTSALQQCSEQNAELLLVAFLGLKGVQHLRAAALMVPQMFLCKRMEYVTDIFNATSGKNITQSDCEWYLSILQACPEYLTSPDLQVSERDILKMAELKGVGHSIFLSPPVIQCINSHCPRSGCSLSIHHAPVNVTVFRVTGPIPGCKVALKCSSCSVIYNYCKYGNKNKGGERFYDEIRELVEISDVVYCERQLADLFTSLNLHCWVSFSGFAEVLYELYQKNDIYVRLEQIQKGRGEITRKHVSDMFFNGELEMELRSTGRMAWKFKADSDREQLFELRESERVLQAYDHTPSGLCSEKGCGRCWAIDGNWKLTFPHCMFPVSNSIPSMPRVNFPNVCTQQPLGRSAFCREHHEIALSKKFPTQIRKFLQQYETTDGDKEQLECVISEALDEVNAENMGFTVTNNVAKAQGVQDFIVQHSALVDECTVDHESTAMCRKNLGEKGKLRHWSRGHVFVVRSCGHVDTWRPIFRSESPSQVFIIIICWLMEVLQHIPVEQWKDVVIAYDNMCQLCGMKAAQSPLPSIEPPYNEMWLKVTNIIDSLHFRNHVDPKCRQLYNPAQVKEHHPKYNTMAAEQTFVWLSRYKRILSSTNKTHHCFYAT